MKNILLIPRIQIHNANALSSPYTIGFPAMTAWLGAAHALQRQLRTLSDDLAELEFKGVGVVCHDINLQTHKGHSDYVYSIIGTGNPLDKSGKRSSFIEEARCHLTVSLVIEYDTGDFGDDQDLARYADQLVTGKMKFAGGDVLRAKPSQMMQIKQSEDRHPLLNKLMPGFCLIERRDLMQQAMNDGLDAIDALLSYLTVNHRSETDEQGNVSWQSSRKAKGWIVPIATGFHGISEVGLAQNQRDPETPHRFAESIVTLGEFKMPYRIENLDHMLWHSHFDAENQLYLCQQNQAVNPL